MHDVLRYMSVDSVYRKYHHNEITFSIYYAFTENFLLPLSHDEVVYGKGSLLRKMPGDGWQRFANLRALFGYMFAHPGKKLLFMGGEFGQWDEWDHERGLDWGSVQEGNPHGGLQRWVRDLNTFYRAEPALWQLDFDASGFEWVDCHDGDRSIISFLRKGKAANRYRSRRSATSRRCRGRTTAWASRSAGSGRSVSTATRRSTAAAGSGNLGAIDAAPVGAHGRYHSAESHAAAARDAACSRRRASADTRSAAMAEDGRRRVVIENVRPQIDGGRFPIKRTVGETVDVSADAFVDGHDQIRCVLRYRRAGADAWHEVPMTPIGNDRWRGEFRVDALGRFEYTVIAWVDHFLTWRNDFARRRDAEDITGALAAGAALVREAAESLPARRARGLLRLAGKLASKRPLEERRTLGLDASMLERMPDTPDRRLATEYGRDLAGHRRAGARAILELVRALPALHLRSRGHARHVQASRGAAGVHRGDGLRRRLSAADSPDRAHEPQRAEQRASSGPARPRLALGDRRERRRTLRDPSPARDARGFSQSRRDRPRSAASSWHSTSRSSARRITPM